MGLQTSTRTYVAKGMLCHNSQFSFGVVDGELRMRSKRTEIFPPVKDKNFAGAAATAQRLFDEGLLQEGWIYRGEAMRAPKHNTLAYGMAPAGNVILFDVDTGLEDRVASPEELKQIGDDLGLLVVPTLHHGPVRDVEQLKKLLETMSVLGGNKVEGVVIKNYNQWDETTGKMLMGKIVSEAFKEKNKRAWKANSPGGKGIIDAIAESLVSEARYRKAVQHLRDDGTLTGTVKDIGPLMREIQTDLEEEEADYIKERLYKWARQQILRRASKGLPEWYKEQLLQNQTFEHEEAA